MILIPLAEILDLFTEDEVEKRLSTFFCHKNEDVQAFLHANAIKYEKAHNARTYLIVNDDNTIMAFFSLALGVINMQSVDSLAQRKRLRGFGRTNATSIPCYLLGQLGRCDCFSTKDISLDAILKYAMEIIHHIVMRLGGRILYLECEDALKTLYLSHEFRIIGKRDQFNIMALSLV